MISLIICSRNSSISPALAQNIASTIGLPHELVVIDNSANNYSIFEAYNIGAARSNYPILCFMHDDIEYHTQDWGKNVLNHFNDTETGAIGIAGTPYFPQMPGSWWAGGMINEALIRDCDNGLAPVFKFADGIGSDKKQVVVLDGVWMCIRRRLFDEIRFDEHTYKGYHFYDIDISLQIHDHGFKLYCVYDILFQHFGKGSLNITWINNALLLQKKWQHNLPAFSTNMSYSQKCSAEYKTLNEYIQIVLSNNIPGKKVYLMAIGQLLKFYKGFFFYKTPVYFWRYLTKALINNKKSIV